MDGDHGRQIVQGLCAELGSLTGPELKALTLSLRSLDARMQGIGAIVVRGTVY